MSGFGTQDIFGEADFHFTGFGFLFKINRFAENRFLDDRFGFYFFGLFFDRKLRRFFTDGGSNRLGSNRQFRGGGSGSRIFSGFGRGTFCLINGSRFDINTPAG